MQRHLKNFTYSILVFQLLFSPAVAVSETSPINTSYKKVKHLKQNIRPKTLIETGDLFIPELKEVDMRLLTSLASGDFLGLSKQAFHTSDESFFKTDPEFGKNLGS